MCLGAASLLFGLGRLRRTTARARGRQLGAVAALRSPHCVAVHAFAQSPDKALVRLPKTQLRMWKQRFDGRFGLRSCAQETRNSVGTTAPGLPGVLELCWVRAVRSRTRLKSSTRAGRRNPGLLLQLRLSWARVYFGSPTFSGFVRTAARRHWLESGQRGGTLVQRLAPSYNVTCFLNSRK